MPLSMQLLPRKFQLNRRGIFTNINKWRSRIVRSLSDYFDIRLVREETYISIYLD